MEMTTDTGIIRIIEVTRDSILFDNGKKLVCEQAKPKDRAEYLYFCDFLALKDKIGESEFDEKTLRFSSATALPERYSFGCGLAISSWLDEGELHSKTFIHTYRIPNPDVDQEWLHKYEHWDEDINDPDYDWDSFDSDDLREWEECCGESAIGARLVYDGKTVMTMNGESFIDPPGPLPFSDAPVSYDPRTAMTITEVTGEYIAFSNGKKITFDHRQNCCESNYADFEQIDDIGRNAVYYENELVFEAIEGSGFRFGNRGGLLNFIPCYSCQNGYYTTELDIFYDSALVLHMEKTIFVWC